MWIAKAPVCASDDCGGEAEEETGCCGDSMFAAVCPLVPKMNRPVRSRALCAAMNACVTELVLAKKAPEGDRGDNAAAEDDPEAEAGPGAAAGAGAAEVLRGDR